jgi:TRAP-type C4-dicarboxylate transport system substrate-binding protein
MEYGEVFSGLQLGQIDANIQPVFAHEEMDFYQVQDYMIFANQAQFIATFMSNQDWYEALSDDRKELIDDVVTELVPYIHDVQTRLNSERLSKITENSDIQVIELTEDERAAFRERSLAVRDTFVEMVGDRGKTLMEYLLEKVGDEGNAAATADGEEASATESEQEEPSDQAESEEGEREAA